MQMLQYQLQEAIQYTDTGPIHTNTYYIGHFIGIE